jgi:hypothetical protein
MKPIDGIIIAVVALIVVAIALYIRKEKKKGKKCIGCSCSDGCGGNCCGK